MTAPEEKIRVLHVEDNPGFAESTAAYLERENNRLDVLTAANPREGLECIAEHDIDCVVSDYEMPGADGIEFLESVRESEPAIPFVLYTGKGSEEVASEAFTAGATDYVRKQSGTAQYELLANRIRNAVEQYRIQRRTQRRCDQYRRLFEEAPVMFATFRLDDGVPRFEEANEQFYEKLGYERAELLDESVRKFYAEESAEAATGDGVERALDGEFGTERRTLLRADGTCLQALNRCVPRRDEYGNVTGLLTLYLDATGRREAGYASGLFRELADEAIDEMYVIEPETGRFVATNETASRNLGYDREELLEMTVHEIDALGTTDDWQRGEWTDETQLSRQRGKHRRADGSTYPVEVAARLAEREGTEYVFAVARDISDRERREEKLRQQKERFEEFASVVSHDLRNPLNVARGNVELLETQYAESDHVESIARSLERMESIIDGLLHLARTGKGVDDLESVSLSEIGTGCWRNVDTEEMDLTVEVDREIRADRNRVKQLLENVYRNAVEHGGTRVTLGELENGFYIADDGPGIPPADRESVFDVSYSTSDGGTGLGLRIVKQVVDAHDWEIRVTERSQGGARFEITDVEFD